MTKQDDVKQIARYEANYRVTPTFTLSSNEIREVAWRRIRKRKRYPATVHLNLRYGLLDVSSENDEILCSFSMCSKRAKLDDEDNEVSIKCLNSDKFGQSSFPLEQ